MDEVTIVAVELAVAQLVIPISEHIEDRTFERRENPEEFVRTRASNIASNHDYIERIRFRRPQFSHCHQVMMDVRQCEQSHSSLAPAYHQRLRR
jgi:hypothetical protein